MCFYVETIRSAWVYGVRTTLAELECDEKRISISVNVSSIQLNNPAFAHRAGAILSKYEISLGRLAIELTESTMVEDFARVTE